MPRRWLCRAETETGSGRRLIPIGVGIFSCLIGWGFRVDGARNGVPALVELVSVGVYEPLPFLLTALFASAGVSGCVWHERHRVLGVRVGGRLI